MKHTIIFTLLLCLPFSVQAQWKKISGEGTYTRWNHLVSLGADGDIWTSTNQNNTLELWHYHDQTLSVKLPSQNFSLFTFILSFADGTHLFEGKDSATQQEKLYLFNGISFANITPPGGPWSLLHYAEMPSDSLIYVIGTRASDGTPVLSFTDRISPWSQFIPPGDAASIDDEFSWKDQGLFFHVRYLTASFQERHLYYHELGSFSDLTPDTIPFDYRFHFQDQLDNIYYSISTGDFIETYSTLHCTNGTNSKEIDLGVDSFDIILSFSTEDDVDRLLVCTNFDGTKQIFAIDALGAIDDITPSGSWSDIEHLHEMSNGVDFFICTRTNSDSMVLYSYQNKSVNLLSGTLYINDLSGDLSPDEEYLYTWRDGNSMNYGAAKSDGMNVQPLVPSDYPSIIISEDNNNPSYINIDANASTAASFQFHQGILYDVTPPGDWSSIFILSVDALGNSFIRCSSGDSTYLFLHHINSGHTNISLSGYFTEYEDLLVKENRAYFHAEREDYPTGITFRWTPDSSAPLQWIDTLNSVSHVEGFAGDLCFVYQTEELKDEIGLILNDRETLITPPIMSKELRIEENVGPADSAVYFIFQDSLDHESLWVCDIQLRGDPCSTDYNFMYDRPIPPGVYVSQVELFSEGRVAAGQMVSFGASQAVELSPTFEAELGSEFEITVPTPCN